MNERGLSSGSGSFRVVFIVELFDNDASWVWFFLDDQGSGIVIMKLCFGCSL
jgi:hypothetical protein